MRAQKILLAHTSCWSMLATAHAIASASSNQSFNVPREEKGGPDPAMRLPSNALLALVREGEGDGGLVALPALLIQTRYLQSRRWMQGCALLRAANQREERRWRFMVPFSSLL